MAARVRARRRFLSGPSGSARKDTMLPSYRFAIMLVALLATAAAAFADSPAKLDPSLVAWYSFEQIAEGKVADLSGHGLDLTVVGTVGPAEGHAGQAADFTGSGYLQTPDSPLLGLTSSVTLECWVWLPAGGSAGRLLDKGAVGQNGAFMLDLHPGNALRLIAINTLYGPVKLATEQWHHVVATYDQDSGYETLYLDGQGVASQLAYGDLTLTTLPLRLGADSNGTSQLRGRLDEVRIYSRALTPAEVLARFAGREVYQPLRVPPPPPVIPVALRDGTLHVDYPALVGHNDVVYSTPALYPFEALPLGNGNLAVTLWNQGGMYFKFNNGSFWRAGGDPMQSSSGEAQLTGDPDLFSAATDFKQRLSLYDAAIYTHATTPQGEVLITSFVAEGQDLLVVHVVDRRTGPIKRRLTLSHWRDDVAFTSEGGGLAMTSDSGLPGKNPPRTGLPLPTTSVVAACADGLTAYRPAAIAPKNTITFTLGDSGPVEYTLFFAAPAVKPDQGDALAYARNMLKQARQRGWRALFTEHQRFWAGFWSKSALYLHGPNLTAEYCAQLWYLNLYWAGCQSRGPYCPKFNGGNFLLEQDQRGWGGSYWYQNTREMFWALPAANHPEMVQPLFDLYESMLPVERVTAREQFHAGGFQVQETASQAGTTGGNQYTHLVLTDGLESGLLFYDWCRYTGNETLLREKVYPYLKEAAQFFLDYAKRGDDGKWHLYPANARETYWRVEDDAPDLYALHACLPILLRESQRLNLDADLRPVWQEFLDNLAPYPTDPATGAYLPCRFRADDLPTGFPYVDARYTAKNISHALDQKRNSESPECELLYPFGLAGIGSPNYDQALATYRAHHACWAGWDPTGIWAARLGLATEALKALLTHAGNQRWPQGWWNTPAGTRWVKALIDVPGFDSAGVNATTLTEMCFQSYDGQLRLWPTFPGAWSGLFRLRALPGFMVTSEIAAGQVRYALIESERGEACRLVNPWEGKLRVTGPRGLRIESAERLVVFPTRAGEKYLVEPIATPLSGLAYAELKPAQNDGPRWPGQTSPQQPWHPGQAIMLGLAKDGHPLRANIQPGTPP